MRIFKHLDMSTDCPICRSNHDAPCFLIPINETIEDGIAGCMQVHVACLDLRVSTGKYREDVLIYQWMEDKH